MKLLSYHVPFSGFLMDNGQVTETGMYGAEVSFHINTLALGDDDNFDIVFRTDKKWGTDLK